MDAIATLTVVGLIVSSIGAMVSIVAIALALVLFLASHRTSLQTLKHLSDIQVSTHATEKTTTEQMATTLTGLIGVIRDKTESTAALEKSRILESVSAILSEEPGIEDDDARRRLRGKVENAVNTAFHSLTYDLQKLGVEPQQAILTPTQQPCRQYPPATKRVLGWIRDNESRFAFLGVKYLRDTIFGADAAAREALQYCIDVGILELHKVDNPENPEWKTTACRFRNESGDLHRILDA